MAWFPFLTKPTFLDAHQWDILYNSAIVNEGRWFTDLYEYTRYVCADFPQLYFNNLFLLDHRNVNTTVFYLQSEYPTYNGTDAVTAFRALTANQNQWTPGARAYIIPLLPTAEEEAAKMTYAEAVAVLDKYWEYSGRTMISGYNIFWEFNIEHTALRRMYGIDQLSSKQLPYLWFASRETETYIGKPKNYVDLVKQASSDRVITQGATIIIQDYINTHPTPPEETAPAPSPGETPPPEEKAPEEPPPEEVTKAGIADIINDIWDSIVHLPDTIKEALGSTLATAMELLLSPIQNIKQTFSDLYTTFSTWTTDILTAVKNAFADLQGFFEFVSQQIKNAVQDVIDTFSGVAGEIIQWIKDLGSSIISGLQVAWGWMSENIKDIVGDVWEWIKGLGNSIKNALTEAWDDIKSVLTSVWTFIRDKFTDVIKAVGNVIDTVGSWIKTSISNILGTFTDFLTDIWQWIIEQLAKLVQWVERVIDVTPDKLAGVYAAIIEGQTKAMQIVGEKMKR